MKLEVQTKESSMRSMGSKKFKRSKSSNVQRVEETKSKILPQGRKVNSDYQDFKGTNSEKADGFWS